MEYNNILQKYKIGYRVFANWIKTCCVEFDVLEGHKNVIKINFTV